MAPDGFDFSFRLTNDPKPFQFSIDGQPQTVRARQWEPVVWISVTPRDPHRQRLDDVAEKEAIGVFPAIVDTGCNESFSIHEWHLEHWALVPLSGFKPEENTRYLHGHACPSIRCDLWLHEPLDSPTAAPTDLKRAIKLEMSGGASVSAIKTSHLFPTQAKAYTGKTNHESVPIDVYPRLPLIGMKTIHSSRLVVSIDGRGGQFRIVRPRRPPGS